MNKDYIDVIKPSGLLRTWIQAPGANQLLTMTMKLTDTVSSTSQDIGAENIEIELGKGTPDNVEWKGKEVAFAFSKTSAAESKLTQTGDLIR